MDVVEKRYLVLVIDDSKKALSPDAQELLVAVDKLDIQVRHEATYREIRLELLEPLTRIQIRELFRLKDEAGRICDFYEEGL